MRCWILLAVVLFAWGACGEDSDVIELDASNFADGVDKDVILVEFYAPW